MGRLYIVKEMFLRETIRRIWYVMRRMRLQHVILTTYLGLIQAKVQYSRDTNIAIQKSVSLFYSRYSNIFLLHLSSLVGMVLHHPPIAYNQS